MMRKTKPVKYGGAWYPSRRALAKAIGTCESNISQVVKRNGDDLDACGYFDERLIREEGVWYCGEHFKSQRALAQHLGVSKNVINKAVARHGIHLDETKMRPSHSRKGKPVSYCGERFESQKALARSLGASEKSVRIAVQEHGNDLDASMIKKALPNKSAGHNPISSQAVWYCGERFYSQAALAQHLCVGESAVRDAIKKHGDHLDASMLRREKPWFIYRCNRYVGDEILDKFGMTPGEARRLIEAHGHDLDEAGVVLRELAPRLSVADIQMTKTEEEMLYGSKKREGVS